MNNDRSCCECRKGDHPNYDDNLVFVRVTNPDTGRLLLAGFVCEEHRGALADDGYQIKERESLGPLPHFPPGLGSYGERKAARMREAKAAKRDRP